jgi:metal-responsive CopG/Arc/MetJ family transcriptional regulator
MATKQINVKLQKNLYDAASSFAENYGYRNIQELASDALREKIFEKSEFDESFSEKEITLVDSIIEKSLKSKKLIDADKYFREFK